VLTARAENHLHGVTDLDDTIARLIAYRDVGADVVYAPGLMALSDIAHVVEEVGCPLNVLALPGTPTVPELASVGVARVSVGSLLAWAAYGALATAARELLGSAPRPARRVCYRVRFEALRSTRRRQRRASRRDGGSVGRAEQTAHAGPSVHVEDR
jgi:2-methylisocitrate lyase-like PEP mutase family enzyme